MQATITLPSQLHKFPITLFKVNKTVYWDEKLNTFYKISFIDPMTMFINEDLVTRQNIIITKYNPAYLALQRLAQSHVINVKQIPAYLNLQMFEPFTDFDGNSILNLNKNKIMDFIEKRIDNLINFVEQKQYQKTVKKLTFINKDKQGKKQITPQIIEVLRKDIPDKFLDEIIMTKYQQNKSRPVVLDNFVQELDKQDEKRNDKKKVTPKPKAPQPLPRNQPTLFQFSGKKQQK